MEAFAKLCWLIAFFAVLPAAFMLWVTFTKSAGAPQEAAGAAMACALVIVPYVLARSVEGLGKPWDKS